MDQKILEKLSVITEEEREILAGKKDINRALYMSGQGNVINSRKLIESGKLITLRTNTRFVHFPEHTHDYVEVVYMCRGESRHLVNGRPVLLSAGEMLFLSQGARHEVLPTGENDIAVNLIIMPPFFEKTLSMLGSEDTPLRTFLIDCLQNSGAHTGYMHFNAADYLPVRNLMENLIYQLLYGKGARRSIHQMTMGLLFLQLLNCTENITFGDNETKIMLDVMSYIEENYASGTLRALAGKLHCSENWLCREIIRRSGKTFTELLQQKRMSQAEFLLRSTRLCVAEISGRVGYENVSYFHKLFFKTHGLTPRRWRMEA